MKKLIVIFLGIFAVASAKICFYEGSDVEVPDTIDCEKDIEALEAYRFPPITIPPIFDWIRTLIPIFPTRPPRDDSDEKPDDPDIEECPEKGIKQISHPKSCEKYILCFGGIEIERSCAEGLHFSRELRVCTDPEIAECEDFDGKLKCPEEDDPDNIVFLPNTEDCTKYYVCFGGEGIPLSCGDGLHWSTEKDACLDPSEANCEFDNGREYCPDEGIKLISHPKSCEKYILCFGGDEIERRCADGLHFSRETRTCVDSDEAGCEDGEFECPEDDDPDNIVFFPNTDDCSMYYVCFGGEKVPLSCADGLHWSVDEELCMDKKKAGCEEFDDREECPEIGVKQISHPKSCEMYILCFGGTEIERNCPAGLHFSRETRTCINPADAGCKDILFECPEEDDLDDLVFFPSLEDCSKYYLCFGGEKVPMSCGSLHWSVDKQMCMDPRKAGCDDEDLEECPEEGIKQISHPDSCEQYILCLGGSAIERNCAPGFHFSRDVRSCVLPELAGCEDFEDEEVKVTCPKEDDPDNIVFLPNQSDCSKYYVCYGGEKLALNCGDGLHWNAKKQWCMHESDAGCKFDLLDFQCPSNTISYHPDPSDCASFIFCLNGQAQKQQCSNGLLWSRERATCDLANLVDCN